MSNPINQRADGCSVFFTFLVLVFLLTGFYIAQKIFEPEIPAPVDQAIDQVRSDKVSTYLLENTNFNSQVDQYHTDKNSTIETVMSAVVNSYNSPALPNKSANP
jgi:hypothetical protein